VVDASEHAQPRTSLVPEIRLRCRSWIR
jgi:hypothetical protein